MFPKYINENTHRVIQTLQTHLRAKNNEEVFEKDGTLKKTYCLALEYLRDYHREHTNFLMNSPVIVEQGITERDVTSEVASFTKLTQTKIDKLYESHNFHKKMLSDILDYNLRGYGNSFLDGNFDFNNSDRVFSESPYDDHKYPKAAASDTHIRQYITLMEYSLRKAIGIDLFLANGSLDFERAAIDSRKEGFRHFFTNIIDAYNWNNYAELNFNDKEETGLTTTFDKSKFNIPIESFKRLLDADFELDISKLQFQGRKTIICDLEKVNSEELEKAAKKMKFTGDLSSVNCFKITSGYKIRDARAFHNYWQLRRLDEIGLMALFEDISGNYLIVSKSPTSSFQAITTSLGRCLGSVNRKVTTAVMDSLDLSF